MINGENCLWHLKLWSCNAKSSALNSSFYTFLLSDFFTNGTLLSNPTSLKTASISGSLALTSSQMVHYCWSSTQPKIATKPGPPTWTKTNFSDLHVYLSSLHQVKKCAGSAPLFSIYSMWSLHVSAHWRWCATSSLKFPGCKIQNFCNYLTSTLLGKHSQWRNIRILNDLALHITYRQVFVTYDSFISLV